MDAWVVHIDHAATNYFLYLWCDLRKHVTWCEIDFSSYCYHVKVWIILVPKRFIWNSYDTSLKSYWCSKVLKIIRIVILISCIFQYHITFTYNQYYARILYQCIAYTIRYIMIRWVRLGCGLSERITAHFYSLIRFNI